MLDEITVVFPAATDRLLSTSADDADEVIGRTLPVDFRFFTRDWQYIFNPLHLCEIVRVDNSNGFVATICY